MENVYCNKCSDDESVNKAFRKLATITMTVVDSNGGVLLNHDLCQPCWFSLEAIIS